MCEHDYKIIKTTGDYYIKRCFKCGDQFKELKNKSKKKTFLQRLFKK